MSAPSSSSSSNDDDERVCTICLDDPANRIVLPCEYIDVCTECSVELRNTSDARVCIQCEYIDVCTECSAGLRNTSNARVCIQCRRPITSVMQDECTATGARTAINNASPCPPMHIPMATITECTTLEVVDDAAAPPTPFIVNSDDSNDDDERMCMICMDAPANTLVLPCEHIVVCTECCVGLRNTSDAHVCIQCRRPITSVMQDEYTVTETPKPEVVVVDDATAPPTPIIVDSNSDDDAKVSVQGRVYGDDPEKARQKIIEACYAAARDGNNMIKVKTDGYDQAWLEKAVDPLMEQPHKLQVGSMWYVSWSIWEGYEQNKNTAMFQQLAPEFAKYRPLLVPETTHDKLSAIWQGTPEFQRLHSY